MKNEKTGNRIASVAGRVLANLQDIPDHEGAEAALTVKWWIFPKWKRMSFPTSIHKSMRGVTVADLKALAASALTQTPDRPKRKAAK